MLDLSLFDGYSIAIYYPEGDAAAGNTARAIQADLAAQGLRHGVRWLLRALVDFPALNQQADVSSSETSASARHGDDAGIGAGCSRIAARCWIMRRLSPLPSLQ